MAFYDGTRLLSLKDLDGNTPEIFMVTNNRSAGKTTFFNRLCVNRFTDKKQKFIVSYRFNYELDDVADKFFRDIGKLFFNDYSMKNVRRASGIYHELVLTEPRTGAEECCGYAISLNSADQLKKMSHFMSDAERWVFDEFQSETNHYCDREITKFISIHTSLARGGGKQVKYLPVYMISNPVSIINPYFVELGISERLQKNTKFLRGHGFVLEQGFNETASQLQKESGFNKAFKKNKYTAYSAQGIYLNDSMTFIEKPTGYNRYLATIRFNGTDYCIREYPELGIVYCGTNVDNTFTTKIAITTADHNINYVMLNQHRYFIDLLRYYFDKGCFRFKDLNCKTAVMKTISY